MVNEQDVVIIRKKLGLNVRILVAVYTYRVIVYQNLVMKARIYRTFEVDSYWFVSVCTIPDRKPD